VQQAADAPAAALSPAQALQLLLVQPKQQTKHQQASKPAADLTPSADAVGAVLAKHLQARLGSLSAQQMHRLIVALVNLNVTPPEGFTDAAAAALQSRLVLLPKGRHVVNVLQALLEWGYLPTPAFMRSFYAATDLLLDTFSVSSCFWLLGVIWDAAILRHAAPADMGALMPPPKLIADMLQGMEGRAIAPGRACEGMRLLGMLRVRPAPALLASWFDASSRQGALRGLEPRLVLAALWGACELQVVPPAAWMDEALEGLVPPGRMSACAPATLAGVLRCLHRLGVVPAPAFAIAAAEAAAATANAGAAWDAESLSVLLGCLGDWGTAPPASAVQALARCAAHLAIGADGASAARLFIWWQAVRAGQEAERMLGGMEPEEQFAVDLALWSATLRHLPRPGQPWEAVSGEDPASAGPTSRDTLPRAALVPLFLAGMAAATRDPTVTPPAWLECAWAGAVGAAAAADALSTSEAAALLCSALVQAPGVHLWDLGTAQEALRSGYRGRDGAPADALQFLALGGDAMGALVESSPPYTAAWDAALRRGSVAAAAAQGGRPGLPAACAAELVRAYQEAAAREQAESWARFQEVAAGLGEEGAGGAWGGVDEMRAAMQEQGLLETRGVGDEVQALQAAVVEDVSREFVDAGFDD